MYTLTVYRFNYQKTKRKRHKKKSLPSSKSPSPSACTLLQLRANNPVKARKKIEIVFIFYRKIKQNTYVYFNREKVLSTSDTSYGNCLFLFFQEKKYY